MWLKALFIFWISSSVAFTLYDISKQELFFCKAVSNFNPKSVVDKNEFDVYFDLTVNSLIITEEEYTLYNSSSISLLFFVKIVILLK